VQVREQAKAFLQKPEDHMQGLNLINSTNLDYFQPQHQAEMINLKAQFFAALGDGDAGVCRQPRGGQLPKRSALLPLVHGTYPSFLLLFYSPGFSQKDLTLSVLPCPAAHGMFSESLTLWPLCWEAWMAWGRFCDGQYDKTKEPHWLEFLATCYLQVRYTCTATLCCACYACRAPAAVPCCVRPAVPRCACPAAPALLCHRRTGC
jgi:transformation/transcription domain-associated protein